MRRSPVGISLIKAVGESRILFEHGQYFIRRARGQRENQPVET